MAFTTDEEALPAVTDLKGPLTRRGGAVGITVTGHTAGTFRAHGTWIVPQASESESFSAGLDGSVAEIEATARGRASANGNANAEAAGSDTQLPPLGLSVGGSGGSSEVLLDLMDVNGDGLPDRLTTAADGVLILELNLGYHFAPPVGRALGR